MTLMENDSRFHNGHPDDFHINFKNLNLDSPKNGKVAQSIFQIKQNKLNPKLVQDAKCSKGVKDAIVDDLTTEKFKYGELILLGYNGSLHEGDKGRKRSKFEMVARSEGCANGVSFRARRKITTTVAGDPGHVDTVRNALDDIGTYAVAYTFNATSTGSADCAAVVVLDEYGLDPGLDMYQVGRSPEKPIDFVVLDTLRAGSTGLYPAHMTGSGVRNVCAPGNASSNGGQHNNIHHRHHHHHGHARPPPPTTPQGGFHKDRANNNSTEKDDAPTPPVKTSTATAAAAILTESTISRFACRFTVQRTQPYTVRVYAAGFDTSNNIFLGPKAVKWRKGDDLFDGLTTNGVLIAHAGSVAPHPDQGSDLSDSVPPLPPQKWFEVSVEGRLYTLRLPQSMNTCGSLVEGQDNVLKDWTLIDICGATLLYRSFLSLEKSPNSRTVESYVEQVNSLKPQCPVRLSTLVVPRRCNTSSTNSNAADNRAYVYLKCGHVQGLHQWGKEGSHNRKCPICQKIGPFAPLHPGNEAAFYVDFGSLTHAFDPCGHMTNEVTARYWSSITIPSAEFKRICPFCATELCDPGFIKLHFQAEN